MKKKIFCMFFGLFMCAASLGACGGGKNGSGRLDGEAEQAAAGPGASVEWPAVWRRNDVGEDREAEGWSVTDYGDNLLHTSAGETTEFWRSACWESRYYCVRGLKDAAGGLRFELCAFDMETDTVQPPVELDFSKTELPGQEDFLRDCLQEYSVILTGMDAGPQGIFLFFQSLAGEDALSYYAIHLNEQMQADSVKDLGVSLAESGGQEEKYVVVDTRVDESGRFLVLSGDAVILLDPEGSSLQFAEKRQEQEYIVYLGKLPDGRLLYQSQNDSGRVCFFLFDGQGKQILYAGDCDILDCCGTVRDGRLICGSLGTLYSWDVTNGEVETIFRDWSINFPKCEAVWMKENGDILLVFYENGNLYYNTLSRGQKADGAEISIACCVFNNQYLLECSSDFAQKHPGLEFQIRESEGWDRRDEEWNSILAELAAGKGPDLLIVTREQLMTLQEKGLAADLSEVLGKECLEQIVPGALEYGTVDGKLYGIVSSATVAAALVSDDVWAADTWTLEDVLGILDEREESGDPAEHFLRYYFDADASQMLYDMLLGDLGHSGLLDLEQGKAYFETDTFRRLLETCKKYGDNYSQGQNLSVEEQALEVKEGKALALGVSGGLLPFSSALAALGEGYHTIGAHPSQEGKGYRLDIYSGCAVVNANTYADTPEKRDAINAFLAYLVDYDTQKKHGTQWVRMDVLRDSVKDCVEQYQGDPIPVFQLEDGGIPLDGKPDGTSYLPEYLEVLQAAVPDDGVTGALQNIILEEAAYYFDGAKTVEETARLIQSRAQLYLDERIK